MAPLLCPSPLILDHSFPRSPGELRKVARALGELDRLVGEEAAEIAMTTTLVEFIDMFEWEGHAQEMPTLIEIHRFCSLLFLSGDGTARLIDVDSAAPSAPHPAPADCENDGLVTYWCEEMGKVFDRHQDLVKANESPFIAVACANKFAGSECPGYSGESTDAFPLVGPEEVSDLGDAFVWDIPQETRDQPVSFADAYRNLSSIGCSGIDKPAGGSHYKVRFAGSRPWVLDPNADPVPHRYLAELEEIVGLPTAVVKYALKNGRLPSKKLRIT